MARVREIDSDGRVRGESQRVGAHTRIDRTRRVIHDDRVVAGARGDRVGAALAVDGIIAGAAVEHVGRGRADERVVASTCVEGDRAGASYERIVARAALDDGHAGEQIGFRRAAAHDCRGDRGIARAVNGRSGGRTAEVDGDGIG